MVLTNGMKGGGTILLHFTGPPVPITARVLSTPQKEGAYTHGADQWHEGRGHNITSFYGSSCANNGKDALNTPETLGGLGEGGIYPWC
eukprot:1195816-Prorocentrum_minimum.AAC.14